MARTDKDLALVRASRPPKHEPEVWDETIPAFNPHLDHTPEPPTVAVSPAFAAQHFDVDEYLEQERCKDLLRFSTAGSVDDGKSTLIGRLLYDTQSVYDDQLRSIEGKGTTAPGVLDLALLTDGLRAEREQGITIDVAYRYFSTTRRKFIIADTPGHEQYTRNMATGASTADVAIILIDARKGVLLQSRRHAFISALLGVRNIIVAVNKMDLVQYSENIYLQIAADFTTFFRAQQVPGIDEISLHFVPVSALDGDNVVSRSSAMGWYRGEPLLAMLETLPSAQTLAHTPFRMAVQRVVRSDHSFRGFAGQIASGTVRVGDSLVAFPVGRRSRVKDIVTFDGILQQAAAPQSVTLTLEDEIDISRGDILAAEGGTPTVGSQLRASLVWMDAKAMELSTRYLLKHMSRSTQCMVREVHAVLHFSDEFPQQTSLALELNEIGEVTIELLQPIAVDPYVENRHTGSFVLIDAVSNLTIAAGMIRSAEPFVAPHVAAPAQTVTPRERALRYGHFGAHVRSGSQPLLDELERALFERGALVVRLSSGTVTDADSLVEAGVMALSQGVELSDELHIRTVDKSFTFASPSNESGERTRLILHELQREGVLLEKTFR